MFRDRLYHNIKYQVKKKDMKSRTFLQSEGGIRSTDPSKEDVQDHDMFISLIGALDIIASS